MQFCSVSHLQAHTHHSCQVYERKDQDIDITHNACKHLQTMPTFRQPYPLSGNYVLPRPLNFKIYRLKFYSIPSLCSCHTSICAIKLDSGTMLQNQANRDIRPTSGTVLAKPGHYDTHAHKQAHIYSCTHTSTVFHDELSNILDLSVSLPFLLLFPVLPWT